MNTTPGFYRVKSHMEGTLGAALTQQAARIAALEAQAETHSTLLVALDRRLRAVEDAVKGLLGGPLPLK